MHFPSRDMDAVVILLVNPVQSALDCGWIRIALLKQSGFGQIAKRTFDLALALGRMGQAGAGSIP